MNVTHDRQADIDDCVITEIECHWLRLPLKAPYENALCRLESFDVIAIKLTDEAGRVGWGEACPVAGYSPETPAQAWRYCEAALHVLPGKAPSAIATLLAKDLATYPFVVSAIHEAMADLGRSALLHGTAPRPIPLLGTVNTLDSEVAPCIALELVAQGYTTLKVKVGYDPDADALRVGRIAEAVAGAARLRIDANQGYDLDQAVRFARQVPAPMVECFEQPVKADRWDLLAEIGQLELLPLMLDESIYACVDIERAASLSGVAAVKLKMSKAGGPAGLAEQIALCREHGLDVVIGNGVASDLGCLHEAMCYDALELATAAEMNGFLKPTTTLLSQPLVVERGRLMIGDPAAFQVDDAKLQAHCGKSLKFS